MDLGFYFVVQGFSRWYRGFLRWFNVFLKQIHGTRVLENIFIDPVVFSGFRNRFRVVSTKKNIKICRYTKNNGFCKFDIFRASNVKSP